MAGNIVSILGRVTKKQVNQMTRAEMFAHLDHDAKDWGIPLLSMHVREHASDEKLRQVVYICFNKEHVS